MSREPWLCSLVHRIIGRLLRLLRLVLLLMLLLLLHRKLLQCHLCRIPESATRSRVLNMKTRDNQMEISLWKPNATYLLLLLVGWMLGSLREVPRYLLLHGPLPHLLELLRIHVSHDGYAAHHLLLHHGGLSVLEQPLLLHRVIHLAHTRVLGRH